MISTNLIGGCTCREVRYQLLERPIVVHCCHCTWCQRETGSAFALNAVIETKAVHAQGYATVIDTPSLSGNGQKITRCAKCHVALWSNYYQAGPALRFIRVGTLDDPSLVTPDIHIYTSSKLPWVQIPAGARAFSEFYNPKEVWSPDALERFAKARAEGGI